MREPVSGYASKKDAIMAMLAEGLSDDEIVFRAKTTAGSVAAYRSQRNARGTMSRETAAKAHRIVEKAIQVMAEGIGCSPAQLHQFIKRNYFGFDRAVHEPALPPEQKVDEAEPARAGLVDTPSDHLSEVRNMVPEPKPTREPEKPKVLTSRQKPMAMEPMTGQCFLKNKATGAYLHYSCTIMTMDKAQRWKGTPQQAAVCRDRFPAAKDLTLINVTP